jgi:hypothetical protein
MEDIISKSLKYGLMAVFEALNLPHCSLRTVNRGFDELAYSEHAYALLNLFVVSLFA